MNKAKVDLTLLNKIVKALNDLHVEISKDREENPNDNHKYIENLAKCMGLVATVAVEATQLSIDFTEVIKINSVPQSDAPAGYMGGIDSLFDGFLSKKKN